MSSQYLDFTEAEYQELETFTFQETVQKSESVRFYTLEEQKVDAYEKLLPKGRVTTVQRNVLKDEIARMNDLYNEYVQETPSEYKIRDITYGQQFDWIFPVYASNARGQYVFSRQWNGLFNQDVLFQGGFYTRMVTSLPNPYIATEKGVNYPVNRITTFLSEEGKKPIRVLPAFPSSKRILHEDGTVEIQPYSISGTQDDVHFLGYYIQKRPFDIPNPLPDHPFLSSNESTFFESTAPIQDVVPSIDAILMHAVPVTTDPYKEGEKYVKLYDIRLGDIPWSSWKSRFPPVDSEFVPREKVNIQFTSRELFAPSDKIVDTYKSPYYPGISTREWLMRQDDGGLFVVKALQSTVINNGSVSNLPVLGPIPEYPSTTAEECALMGLKFHDFTIKGLLRRSWKLNKDKDDIRMACIPLEFVKQERARAGYYDRLPWQETTGLDMITEYLKILRAYRIPMGPPTKEEPVQKTPARPDSPLYLEVLAILQDKNRSNSDKLKDIQTIVIDAILSNEVYTDSKGDRVVCSHTLAVLAGDMEDDRRKFYDKWTVAQNAYRICRFCGQHVVQVDAVDQDEYDDRGFLIKQKAALEGPKSVLSDTLSSYISNVRDLVHVFDQTDISESLCYQIISILQVMPNVNRLNQILAVGRSMAKPLKQDSTNNSLRGGLGVALAILILQSDASLVPKRSFGPKPLKLNGYPRDTEDVNAEKFTIIDSLLYAIEKTYRGFPSALDGPAAPIIRTVLTDSKKIRNNTVVALKNIFKIKPEIRTLLNNAKMSMDVRDIESTNITLPLSIPPSPEDIGKIREYIPCDAVTTSILTSEVPPRIRQPVIDLRSGLTPSQLRTKVTKAISVREEVAFIEKAVIQEKEAKKKEAMTMKIEISPSYRTNLMVASRLADAFLDPMPIRNVDFQQNPDDLRDIGSGFLYDALTSIKQDPEKTTELEKLRRVDATLYCLMMNYESEKKAVLSIRASERLRFVERMGQLTDEQREMTSELLKRGLAPYIITVKDRALFAKEQELRALEKTVEEETEPVDNETGVGESQYIEGAEEDALPNADAGNNGDLAALPADRDYTDQPNLWDNEND